jgi:hypothetical protein
MSSSLDQCSALRAFRDLEGSLQVRTLFAVALRWRFASDVMFLNKPRLHECVSEARHVSSCWRVLICNISGGADGYGTDDGDFKLPLLC